MDDFERRLKDDAAAIEVEVSAALEKHIAASVQAVGSPAPPARREPRARRNDLRWWTFSTLTGAAAVLLVLVAVNWQGSGDAPPGTSTVAGTASGEMPPPGLPQEIVPLLQPLDVRTAEFADPLSRELEAFKSDLEKARSELEEDLRFTF